jgi:hypothetical protein
MNQRQSKAQAVTELAIFGAVLIFVIGAILRNSVDAGVQQQQTLKAMRWAMSKSLSGVRNSNKSRVAATVIFVEDRLAPDAGKFGSMERSPIVQVSSGVFTNNMFLPLDWGENYNLSLMDVIVNGVHFSLSTEKFIAYDIRLDPNNPAQIRVWDLTNNVVTYFPKDGNWLDNCSGALGCPLFYTLIPLNNSKFCATTCPNSIISMDQRFDLNRNNVYADDPVTQRSRMNWQWDAVRGLKSTSALEIDIENVIYPNFDVDGDRKDETIYAVNPPQLWARTGAAYDVQTGAEPLVSPAVDMAALQASSANTDVIQQLYVVDRNKGDVDSSTDDLDLLARGITAFDRGLLRDISLYSQTNDGTYLEINEGRAFVPNYIAGSQFVRSTTKKDAVDVITRLFKLDNNSGRFCGTVSGTRWATIGNDGALPNPVEYCVNTTLFPGATCFTPATVSSTCYDAGSKTLFIRSRVTDKSGRRWATQVR